MSGPLSTLILVSEEWLTRFYFVAAELARLAKICSAISPRASIHPLVCAVSQALTPTTSTYLLGAEKKVYDKNFCHSAETPVQLDLEVSKQDDQCEAASACVRRPRSPRPSVAVQLTCPSMCRTWKCWTGKRYVGIELIK
jgi:hypothetical protein